MNGSTHNLVNIFILILVTLSITSHSSASLSTNGRWIVSPSGDRVKLRCVNWSGHLYAMIPEGLNKQPLKGIVEKVKILSFNCVRLTWAVNMYTLDKNLNLTVEQSLIAWNLEDARDGVSENNPNLLTMTIAEAQKAVVDELGANNLMVVLDNHVSEPIWCCSSDDGNGFFGDKFFDPDDWLKALKTVAMQYKGNSMVVGMSMRNELHGPGQDVSMWYKFMEVGATVIHNENPDVLVIVSGLNYDTNITFLQKKPFNALCPNKLVFESHTYAFDDPLDKWKYQTNEFCGNQTKRFWDQSGFVVTGGSADSNTYPLFISEFGVDLQNDKEIENYFLSCTLAYLAEYDFDWAFWALQGSEMLREGVHDSGEDYGILSTDWVTIRNLNMLQKLQLIQQINLGSNLQPAPFASKMFHPQTGMCVQVDKYTHIVHAGNCLNWASWIHPGDGLPITLLDGRCLVAVGDRKPVSLSASCLDNNAAWNLVSGSKLHIASKDEQGNSLCLQWDNPSAETIVTRKCLCVDENNNDLLHCEDNPMIQWFKLVPFNIN